MYNYHCKIVLAGDISKYTFLKSILSEELRVRLSENILHTNDIRVIYSDRDYIEVYDDLNIIEIASKSIPIGKLLIIPTDFYRLEKEKSFFDKLIMFNAFPYGKHDLVDEFMYLLNKFEILDSVYVIYKEKRNFASTDLTNEEESVKKALMYLNSNNIKSLVYDSSKEDVELFKIEPNFTEALKNAYKSRFINTWTSFERRFEKEYEFYIKDNFKMFSLLDPDEYKRFNMIFSYNKIKNSNDIWITFYNNFKSEYLENRYGLLFEIKEFYIQFIKEICIWDLKMDIEILSDTIVEKYSNTFEKHKVIKSPNSELEYIRTINDKSTIAIDVVFKQRLNHFFEVELKELLYMYIRSRLDEIRVKIGDIEDEEK